MAGDTAESRGLAALSTHAGPFATVYVASPRAVPDAAERFEVRWKDLARELRDAGADDATADAVVEARGEHTDGGTRVVVAAHGRVLLARSLPEATDVDAVRVGPLPHLLPLLDWLQTRVPHVVVLADRTGADVLAYVDGPEQVIAGAVDGAAHPVHKTGKGGWSARRFEHAVEESWERTARDVADTVAKVAAQTGPRVIALGGDERAVGLVREHLPEDLAGIVAVIDGTRAEDGSDERTADAVLAAVGERAAAEVIDLLGDFGQERGRRGAAADGPEQTVDALRQAQVRILLLTDEMSEDALAYFGPDPTSIALDPGDLTALGVQRPEHAALVDVLLRAALATDAEVRFVPGGTEESPTGGVGALLRWNRDPVA